MQTTRAAPSIWDFGRPGAPILVRNAEVVFSHLAVFLDGWPLRRAGNDTATETDLVVEMRSDGSFAVISHAPGGGEMLFETDFDAANGLAGALVGALITQDRDRVCLHAGSAQIGDRGDGLAVFVGDSLAGKSSLALHLTVAGYRLFGDDRLEIRLSETADPVAICLGLMPKVRLPLPDRFGHRFAAFVDACSEVQFGDVAYLKPGSGEAACFGEAAPVAALVVLERGGGAPAALERLPRAELVRALLCNCFAPHLSAEELVVRMNRLAGAVPGYRLRFTDSRQAAQEVALALKPRSRSCE